ncbi:hypothetical protein DXG01_006453 [Tephrocybe rancida]|nr:hypothetical protein DXG01_006453 [Tephrocybe rancida]
MAGYTDDTGNKVAISSPSLAPGGIILDAELTLATPERLWLSSGTRALDHAHASGALAPGLSHALGHKLGAKYGIPHGITSCLTLAPTVALKAKVASQEDRELLAKTLFYLQQPSTGSVDGDVVKLSSLIHQLVDKLGLQSTLTEYNVPVEDLSKVAAGALGSEDDPTFPEVVRMLKGLY